MTRVSDTFRTRYGSMIEVSVLHRVYTLVKLIWLGPNMQLLYQRQVISTILKLLEISWWIRRWTWFYEDSWKTIVQ